jgi:ATP-dependent Lon protease
MGELIPLFPLGTPLFPGVVLPLHVFEPRYRRLMRDLLSLPESSDRRFFGVVAIRQGWEVEQVAPAEALYDVGCTARVRRVASQPDGGFAIVTVGGDRFRLLDVIVGDDPPYLQGEVEWLADEEAAEEYAGDTDGLRDPSSVDGAVAADLALTSMEVLVGGVAGLFAEYVAQVAALGAEEDEGEVAELLQSADDPASLSWLVASAALLTTEDRQALLAESATRRRLAAEARVLRRELTLLQTLRAVPVPLRSFAAPMTVN